MKTRKTMMGRLKAYHKKRGGFSTVIKLSEMLWKQYNISRTMHTYRLKSARGNYRIWSVTDPWCLPFGKWNIQKIGSIHPRLTNHPLRVHAALYQINRNGGANV